jgi:hypothetical protein
MPAKSASQKRLMDAAAHNPAFAKKVGIPSKVAKEYSESSKGMSFKKGDEMKTKKMNVGGATRTMPASSNKGGAMRGLERAAAMSGRTMPSKSTSSTAPTGSTGMLSRFAEGARNLPPRPAPMKKGGAVKKMASGGLAAGHKSADGIVKKGKTKGKEVAMRKGGKVC